MTKGSKACVVNASCRLQIATTSSLSLCSDWMFIQRDLCVNILSMTCFFFFDSGFEGEELEGNGSGISRRENGWEQSHCSNGQSAQCDKHCKITVHYWPIELFHVFNITFAVSKSIHNLFSHEIDSHIIICSSQGSENEFDILIKPFNEDSDLNSSLMNDVNTIMTIERSIVDSV